MYQSFREGNNRLSCIHIGPGRNIQYCLELNHLYSASSSSSHTIWSKNSDQLELWLWDFRKKQNRHLSKQLCSFWFVFMPEAIITWNDMTGYDQEVHQEDIFCLRILKAVHKLKAVNMYAIYLPWPICYLLYMGTYMKAFSMRLHSTHTTVYVLFFIDEEEHQDIMWQFRRVRSSETRLLLCCLWRFSFWQQEKRRNPELWESSHTHMHCCMGGGARREK